MINDFRRRARRERRGHSPLGERLEKRHYTTAPRTWIPGELVTSNMMNTLRDLFLEIEAGTADYQKLNMIGRTSAVLASDLSDSGEAKIAYDSTLNSLVASVNGAAYSTLGGGSSFDPYDPIFVTWGFD